MSAAASPNRQKSAWDERLWDWSCFWSMAVWGATNLGQSWNVIQNQQKSCPTLSPINKLGMATDFRRDGSGRDGQPTPQMTMGDGGAQRKVDSKRVSLRLGLR
jgi:hypothetical protein